MGGLQRTEEDQCNVQVKNYSGGSCNGIRDAKGGAGIGEVILVPGMRINTTHPHVDELGEDHVTLSQ